MKNGGRIEGGRAAKARPPAARKQSTAPIDIARHSANVCPSALLLHQTTATAADSPELSQIVVAVVVADVIQHEYTAKEYGSVATNGESDTFITRSSHG
uniref:Uncharacterized protein n=1 Tax=Plectus sambesii TaxID=2011161 RepID=A0A914W010_9BILA